MIFKKTFSDLFNPRFSTGEIESSKLKCNLHFETTDLYFDDLKRGYPTHILGFVKTKRGIKIRSAWNQQGECWVTGIRVKSFDMIRPTQREMDSAKTVAISTMVLFSASVVYAIL